MAKEYFATKAMQDTTNTRLEELVAEMNPPDLASVNGFIADFLHDDLTIIKGGLVRDERIITV